MEWIKKLLSMAGRGVFESLAGSLVMSAVFSAGSMAWAWLTQWGILPIAVIGLVVFTAAFWLINAVTWRRRLEKPNTKTPSFDYSYGIDVCAIRMARDNEQDGIQVGIILRNALEAPIAYEVEDFTVSIADTTRDNPDFSNTGGVIHAKGTRVYFSRPCRLHMYLNAQKEVFVL